MADVIKVLTTTDYNIFKNIKGNREIDDRHVKQLIKSLATRGNLTNEFPIVVNEHMEIIDGQHRLAALKTLEWPVAYRIQPGLTIDTVRHINAAGKNWGWKDYAQSYAARGNENYQRVLELEEKHHQGYHVLSAYGGFGGNNMDKANGGKVGFIAGELIFTAEDKTRTDELLDKATELIEILRGQGISINRTMYRALQIIMQSPEYDHDRMYHKVLKHGNRLKSYALLNDQLRAFEDIYNHNVKDGSAPVRLF